MEIKDSNALGFIKSAPATDKKKETKLREACADFEAIILRQLLKTMRETVPKDGLFAESHASSMYQSMHDGVLADELAHGRGAGLGEMLYRQLSRPAFQPPTSEGE